MEKLDSISLLQYASEVATEPSQVVEFKPTAGFRPFKKLFVKEAVKHPAKANLHMIRWIIEKWTKKGETILDPMAGTYSTCIMAAMLERNAIGMDYEEKFYQMGLKNKELFESTYMMPKGKIAVLKGDARSLSDVLFANSETIDTIVTSPPYEGSMEDRGGTQKKFQREKKIGVHYSSDRSGGQIGNLQARSYLAAMLQVYRECLKVLKPNGLMILITKNFIRKKQVVRLDLDTIKLCRKAGFRFVDRWYRKLTRFSFWVLLYRKKYPEVEQVNYEDILVFQKPAGEGDVDAVIFSPPYSEALSPRRHKLVTGNGIGKRDPALASTGEYTGCEEDNIGNLPYGQIDAIITSPPYAKAVSVKSDPEARRKRLEKAGYKNYQGGKARCLDMQWSYSQDEQNLGNLPYGSMEDL